MTLSFEGHNLCGHYAGYDPEHYGVGMTRDGGRTFTRVMAFTDIANAVTCPAASKTRDVCRTSGRWRAHDRRRSTARCLQRVTAARRAYGIRVVDIHGRRRAVRMTTPECVRRFVAGRARNGIVTRAPSDGPRILLVQATYVHCALRASFGSRTGCPTARSSVRLRRGLQLDSPS